jgi:DNA relaxase NicK
VIVRFDAYSATTTAVGHMELLTLLKEGLGGEVELQQGKGFHTFKERLSVRQDTREVGSISWGGEVQGTRCMVEVKGEGTPPVVDRLRAAYAHRCTRVDSCADFDAPGAFDALLEPCTAVKRKHRLRGEKRGDWDDHPDDGRTLMLGAPTSPVRARLYEKGRTPDYRHLGRPDWARLEVQIRPVKAAKDGYAHLDAFAVWGASAWTRELAAHVLAEHVHPHPAGTVYRQPDLDRRIHWLCQQYGGTLLELVRELGSWAAVGATLEDEIARIRRQRH